ncbi:MAG: hypothetical protein NTY68_01310 [Candidatus Micrarchaeota archaeon]|nr:hypothetical protein [Candidatus Micrarchaeota archaeon]
MSFDFALLGLVALAGFSSKMLDGFIIKKRIKDAIYLFINLIFIIAGTLAAISISPETVISLLIALILMGKIDKEALRIAYSFVLLITLALIRDVSALNPLSIAMLTVCGIIDEMELKIIRDYRPSMWIGAAAIGLLIGNWNPFFAIALFDIGYAIALKTKPSFLKLLK